MSVSARALPHLVLAPTAGVAGPLADLPARAHAGKPSRWQVDPDTRTFFPVATDSSVKTVTTRIFPQQPNRPRLLASIYQIPLGIYIPRAHPPLVPRDQTVPTPSKHRPEREGRKRHPSSGIGVWVTTLLIKYGRRMSTHRVVPVRGIFELWGRRNPENSSSEFPLPHGASPRHVLRHPSDNPW